MGDWWWVWFLGALVGPFVPVLGQELLQARRSRR